MYRVYFKHKVKVYNVEHFMKFSVLVDADARTDDVTSSEGMQEQGQGHHSRPRDKDSVFHLWRHAPGPGQDWQAQAYPHTLPQEAAQWRLATKK